jgi:hypothetical protein
VLPAIVTRPAGMPSRAARREVERQREVHAIRLSDELLARDRAVDRIQGGGDLLATAGSVLCNMVLAEANLAALNPAAALRVTAMIDQFTVSAASVIDNYMRRPM